MYTRGYKMHNELYSCDQTNTIYIENDINKSNIIFSLDSCKLFNIFVQYKVDLDHLSFFKK